MAVSAENFDQERSEAIARSLHIVGEPDLPKQPVYFTEIDRLAHDRGGNVIKDRNGNPIYKRVPFHKEVVIIDSSKLVDRPSLADIQPTGLIAGIKRRLIAFSEHPIWTR